jgi:hypothetical protein
MVFAALLVIIAFSLAGFLGQFFGPVPGLSGTGVLSGVIVLLAAPVALGAFREARRLGRLLQDPARLMELEGDTMEKGGLNWSALVPWFGRRD